MPLLLLSALASERSAKTERLNDQEVLNIQQDVGLDIENVLAELHFLRAIDRKKDLCKTFLHEIHYEQPLQTSFQLVNSVTNFPCFETKVEPLIRGTRKNK